MKTNMEVSLRKKMAKEKKVRYVEKERKREQKEEERYKQFTALLRRNTKRKAISPVPEPEEEKQSR